MYTEVIQAPGQCVTRTLEEHAIGKRYGTAELTVKVVEFQNVEGFDKLEDIDELERLVHDHGFELVGMHVTCRFQILMLFVGLFE